MQTTSAIAWKRGGLFSAMIGVAAGLFAMWAAWDHNPQQEFHGVDGVNWSAWLAIGASWTVAIGGVCWVPLAALTRVLIRRSSSDAA